MTINSRQYWDARFASGNWQQNGGNTQTSQFAQAQVKRLMLAENFSGSIVDFGCGEGDALPVFHRSWPQAGLTGVDFSEAAIQVARARYGMFSAFVVGSQHECPPADVIVASNVMEHLDDDITVVEALVRKCDDLFIVVPFEEQFLVDEHVRRYDRASFSSFEVVRVTVFPCKGWSHFGLRDRWWNIHVKNVLRPIFGRDKLNRRLQAIFHIRGRRGRD